MGRTGRCPPVFSEKRAEATEMVANKRLTGAFGFEGGNRGFKADAPERVATVPRGGRHGTEAQSSASKLRDYTILLIVVKGR
jgi:hypothetical protein